MRLSQKVDKNYPREVFFSNYLNGLYPVKNTFEVKNEPLWAVQSYFGILYHFRRKSPKTTMRKKRLSFK